MADSHSLESYYTLKKSDVLYIRSLDQPMIPAGHVVINNNGILITKCIFTEKLVSEILRNHTMKFSFQDCIFKEGVNFENHTKLEFSDCQFEDASIFSGTKNHFQIRKCKFAGTVNISGTVAQEHLLMEECELEDNLMLNIHSHENVLLSRIKTKRNIYIHNTQIDKTLTLSEIEVFSLEFDKKVSINNELTLFKINAKHLMLLDLEVTDIILIGAISTQTFRIVNLKTSNLACTKIKCNEITQIPIESIQKLHFRDSLCRELIFSGQIAKESYHQFINCEFDEFKITNLKNEGTLELNQLQVKKSFQLLLSDLKKTDFIHCNMKESKWIFKNSKIAEVFVAGTSFPQRVYNESGIQDEEQARLAYGQLHKAMLNMGDAVNALYFQSSEIAAHYRQLKWNNSWKEGFTKFNLFLNWISNDFGRSWVRGIGFSFGFAILCFYGLTLSTKEYTWGWRMDMDPNLLGSFFRFINPLRFYETEKIFESAGGLKLTPGSYLIDFLSRVIIAYGFYQTIQAFRRLGKS